MNSLWPSDLLLGLEPEPLKTLKEQATKLEELTLGRIQARVDQVVLGGVIMFRLTIAPLGAPTSQYELVCARTQTGGLPCVFDATHTEQRLYRADTPEEVGLQLSEIFSHETTKKIIRSLVDSAITENPSKSYSSLSVAGEFSAGEAHASITIRFGSTYATVFMDTVSQLMNLGEDGPYHPLGGDQFVVQIENALAVRTVASLADITTLQQELRQSLMRLYAPEVLAAPE